MSTLPDDVRTALDGLVRSDRVVLFMKGSRQQPRCGFSATVVQLLDQHLEEYTTVDILEDDDLREAMKAYASWPTYPQLWVGGEFVGGADITKQLATSGDLAGILGSAGAPSQEPVPPPVITVTDAARDRIVAALEGEDAPLRLSIDAQFQYGFEPAEAILPSDVEVSANGVRLVLDRASAKRASGLTLDFVTGPSGQGLVIDNPNEPPRVRSMQVEDLAKWLERREDFVLLDVRTDGEAAIASIPGARLLDEETEAWVDNLPKTTRLVFVCHHGVRSAHAAQHFLRAGFRYVWNVAGGIDAWSTRVDGSVARY